MNKLVILNVITLCIVGVIPGLVSDYALAQESDNSDPSWYQQQVNQAMQQPATAIKQKTLDKISQQLTDHKEIEQRPPLDLAPFHQRTTATQTSEQTTVQTNNLCLGCHNALPHQKSPRSRSFLNMHSQTISCQSCHIAPKLAGVNYQWQQGNGQFQYEQRFV